MAALTDVLAEAWRKGWWIEGNVAALEAALAPVIEAAKTEAVREALAEVERRLEAERDYWSERADRADTGIQVALNGAALAGVILSLNIAREVRAARGGE